jgi:hypothetical protein
MMGLLRFERAHHALQFFRGNFPAYMSLHIGFSTRKTPDADDPDVNFDEDEPEAEGGDGIDKKNGEWFYPYYNHTLVSQYLPAVEALICHPLVAPVIEAGRTGVVVDRPFVLKNQEEWTPSALYGHLDEICDACGVPEAVRRTAILDALAVFITSDSKEVIGYIDDHIPTEWTPERDEGEGEAE